jgi:sulfur carrier protein ThiS
MDLPKEGIAFTVKGQWVPEEWHHQVIGCGNFKIRLVREIFMQ